MYKVLLILIGSFLLLSNSSETEDTQLTIFISDCRSLKESFYFGDLVLLKDGKEFTTVKVESYDNPQIVRHLKPGIYTLIYQSLFNKEERLQIDVSTEKECKVTLCLNQLDYSKETYQPIINRLRAGTFYTIIISSQGCFHSTRETIKIQRNKNIYTIKWGGLSKELTEADKEAIRHFEMELNYMNQGGCTTINTYEVKYRGDLFTIHDGSCSWNGDFYLKKQLFNQKETG